LRKQPLHFANLEQTTYDLPGPLPNGQLKKLLAQQEIFLSWNTGWDFFLSPAVTIVFTGFLKQNLCPFQKLRLWFILIIFLKFRKFQPRHFYEISSYKKGVAFFI